MEEPRKQLMVLLGGGLLCLLASFLLMPGMPDNPKKVQATVTEVDRHKATGSAASCRLKVQYSTGAASQPSEGPVTQGPQQAGRIYSTQTRRASSYCGYGVGSSIQVVYNSQRPQQAVVRQGMGAVWGLRALGMVLLALGAFFGWRYWQAGSA